MQGKLPIFYSALLLTLVNLLLRFAGTSFQVYLSARIGPEGIGLLQLVMSVGSMALVAGMAGVRTATMYFTAAELGAKHKGSLRSVLSGCMRYSILCSGAVAATVYIAAPYMAEIWIGNGQTAASLRLFAAFLPVNCLTGVMVGYFTGANRIGTLAAVEVAEQICSMVCTLALLHFWAGADALRCCLCVIMGSGLGSCLTFSCLVFLRLREEAPPGPRIPMARRLLHVAVPLGLADDLKTGINTVENLMVPRRLARFAGVLSPLASFGIVSGMVFPVLMFPACILYALAELLIPELARCAAAKSKRRIAYLVQRGLKVAMLYGVFFGGMMILLGKPLCMALYKNEEAGRQLCLYALLVPMLYCDALTDAMTKGLGQQKACVRYNIFTSFLDVVFLYLLLPKYGMMGYFFSFLVTHVLNFGLSIRRLMKITQQHIALHIPLCALVAGAIAVWIAGHVLSPAAKVLLYPITLLCLLRLLGVVGREDVRWLRRLVVPRSMLSRAKASE